MLCGSLLCGSVLPCAFAGPIVGTFNLSGTITVDASSTITWKSDVGEVPGMFTLTAGAGIYSLEDGQNSIVTLTNPPEIVGAAFEPPDPFIEFDVDTALSTLDIDYLYAGTGGTAGCTAAPNFSGTQTCTIAGSPFTFINTPAGTSTASFEFAGVSADGLYDWGGTFTSQFLAPFQTVVASFIADPATATITNSYSATVYVSPASPVSEPASYLLVGLGLIAFPAYRKFRRV
jgi:hypothetical protein